MGASVRRPRRAVKAAAGGVPRYRVPQHWARQLGGTLGDQLVHLGMDLEAARQALEDKRHQALEDKRHQPMVRRVVSLVRARGEMAVSDAAAELGLSVSTARNHFELACALGVLSSRMERVGCTRRNVYKVVAGRG